MNQNQVVKIGNSSVSKIEYKNQPVITFRMMDELHERPVGTAGRNFRANRDRFIEGEDFFSVPYEEWNHIPGVRISSSGQDTGQRNAMTFLTESGYLLLAKSFTDDLAWKVQRELVNCYFVMAAFSERGHHAGIKSRLDASKLYKTCLSDAKSSGLPLHDAVKRAVQIVQDETGYDFSDLLPVQQSPSAYEKMKHEFLQYLKSIFPDGIRPRDMPKTPPFSKWTKKERDEILNDLEQSELAAFEPVRDGSRGKPKKGWIAIQ